MPVHVYKKSDEPSFSKVGVYVFAVQKSDA